MAKIQFKGLDEYVSRLNKLNGDTDRLVKRTVYVGADVVADTIKQAINGLPTDNSSYKKDGIRTGPTSIQKAGLVASFGITPMRKELTETNVKLGFDGYNRVVTKRWSQGQPNAMIARSIESGTSWMVKNPFVSKATRSAKKIAEEQMKKEFEEEIEKLMK